ncbi:MAG: V-type ATP synthase subunit F [Caldisphaera sp.]|nr:MAG: V-type ATP synthase subunit F [Caldisphaera sp.]PMP88232.1 MAG: V-type ATP synthase subunit F [Caldisphaera sp.]
MYKREYKLSVEGKVYIIGDKVSINLFRIAGIPTIEANSQKEVENKLKIAKDNGANMAIILKHLVTDEKSIRKIASALNLTILILPTKWSKAEPINIDKLLAEALGMG